MPSKRWRDGKVKAQIAVQADADSSGNPMAYASAMAAVSTIYADGLVGKALWRAPDEAACSVPNSANRRIAEAPGGNTLIAAIAAEARTAV